MTDTTKNHSQDRQSGIRLGRSTSPASKTAARTDLVDLRNNDSPSEGVGDDPYLLYVFATSNHDAAGRRRTSIRAW